MWAFSFTVGNECGLGEDSKFVLKRESIRVDFPKPVSPENDIFHKISKTEVNNLWHPRNSYREIF